jgi:hypothetical protein
MELVSSLIRARFAPHTQRVETYGEQRCRFKNDLESDYPFPRIAAMQGDGKTSYDVSKDGIPTQIGECAVRTDIFGTSLRFPTNNTGRLPPRQGSDKTQSYLCQGHGIGRTSTHTFFSKSSFSIRIQVKLQWKGCECFVNFWSSAWSWCQQGKNGATASHWTTSLSPRIRILAYLPWPAMLAMHMSTYFFYDLGVFVPLFIWLNYNTFDSIISVTVSSAILSTAEAPRDKFHVPESGPGWFSFTRFLIFGAVITGVWYAWKMYGRRYFRDSDPFGRGGGGVMWADSKRFWAFNSCAYGNRYRVLLYV